MTDNAKIQRSAVVLPLVAGSSNSLLQDADPALFYLLDFLRSVLETYLGPRMAAACAAANLTQVSGQVISGAVAQAFPYDPGPWLLENHFDFPLLAVWRQKEVTSSRTTTWRHSVDTLGCSYILPPMSAEQAEQVLPILRAVGDVIDNRMWEARDPAYAPPGGNLDDPYSDVPYANLEYGILKSVSYGTWSGTGNLVFHAWLGSLEVAEREHKAPGTFGSTFTGADVTLNEQADDGSVLPFAQLSTTPSPTLTQAVPSSGAVAGGTTTVLTGTFLEKNAVVTFGGTPAAGVTFISPTMLVATLPAHAAGTVDVVVTNPDGTTATLAGGLTFQ